MIHIKDQVPDQRPDAWLPAPWGFLCEINLQEKSSSCFPGFCWWWGKSRPLCFYLRILTASRLVSCFFFLLVVSVWFLNIMKAFIHQKKDYLLCSLHLTWFLQVLELLFIMSSLQIIICNHLVPVFLLFRQRSKHDLVFISQAVITYCRTKRMLMLKGAVGNFKETRLEKK